MIYSVDNPCSVEQARGAYNLSKVVMMTGLGSNLGGTAMQREVQTINQYASSAAYHRHPSEELGARWTQELRSSLLPLLFKPSAEPLLRAVTALPQAAYVKSVLMALE